jgi:hypothetical protein
MISLNCYSNTCANDGLIRLNKFVSRFQACYVISFLISIRKPLPISYEIFDVTSKCFQLPTKHPSPESLIVDMDCTGIR